MYIRYEHTSLLCLIMNDLQLVLLYQLGYEYLFDATSEVFTGAIDRAKT